MSLRERVYSILVVSAAANFTSAFANLLLESRYHPVDTVTSISTAKRILAEKTMTLLLLMHLYPTILEHILLLIHALQNRLLYYFL